VEYEQRRAGSHRAALPCPVRLVEIIDLFPPPSPPLPPPVPPPFSKSFMSFLTTHSEQRTSESFSHPCSRPPNVDCSTPLPPLLIDAASLARPFGIRYLRYDDDDDDGDRSPSATVRAVPVDHAPRSAFCVLSQSLNRHK
ncbi:unnamed protein product, partial [Soboliphyme baturini]|uniref:Formin_GBD_N domain-containing protein n=1 Tax=Soboliphyme baturini TaxID=241478 RepID=A0A183IIL7_9BILA